MNVLTCPLEGPLIIEPKVFGDPRGFFVESYNRARYRQAGIELEFMQDNFSFSCRHTLRGLHAQNPNPQFRAIAFAIQKVP